MRRIFISFVFIIISFNFNYSQDIPELAGTKWKFYHTQNAFDYLIFKSDSSYIDFNYELGEKYIGIYYIKKDTVILLQEKGEYEDKFPLRRKAGKSTTKYLYKNGKLILIYFYMNEWGKLKKPIVDFEIDIIFEKDESYKPQSKKKQCE